MKKFSAITAMLLVVQFFTVSAIEADKRVPAWPRSLETEAAVIKIYQPQINSLEGDMLDARAAISVKKTGEDLIFGAMWFTSRLMTDFDTRLVDLEEVKIQSVKFPAADKSEEEALITLLEKRIPEMDLLFSLDRLLTSLEMVEKSDELSDKINTVAPNILYENEAAVLVLIDGDPILEDIENTKLKYVANTPYFILYNTSDMFFYLKGGKWWYRAGRVENAWREIDNPPAAVQQIADQLDGTYDTDVDSIARTMKVPPKIVLSKEPAELIITDGEPDLATLEGTNLLYVRNTENEILMDINTQDYFVLVSGRWYKSKQLDQNNWIFVDPSELPDEFARIKAESEVGSVRASIPGTDEAREALLENEIPQTAVIDRKTANIKVEYDGSPEFDRITGTEMSYATNTDKSVLYVGNRYYAVDDAVWYMANSPSGPWGVCVEVPDAVYSIPPSYPVYNVKYVYVYDYTPDVVYVGYTPGYYSSYRYRGTVVYGTGYYYRPWYRTRYYPHHTSYGYGVHYNPYTGWGFSTGISYGWIGYSYYSPYYYTSWWGPSGYRYGYRHGYYSGFNRGYYSGYYHGYNYGVYTSSRSGYSARYRDGHHYTASNNIYKSSQSKNVISTGTRSTTYGSRSGATGTRSSYSSPRTTDRQNNVYTDRNGNVYRQRGDTWQERTDGSWKKSDVPVRTQTRTTPTERTGTTSTTERTRTTTVRTGTSTSGTNAGRTSSTYRSSPGSTSQIRSGSTSSSSGSISRSSGSAGRSSGSTLIRESAARSQGSQRTYIYQQSRPPSQTSTGTRSSSTSRSSTSPTKQPVKKSTSPTTTRSSGNRSSSELK